MSEALPTAVIGILGGGQLARMLAVAASRLGLVTHILDPDPNAPARAVTPHVFQAAYEDETALARFADAVDVVTYEFENIPASSLEFLSKRVPIRPGLTALETSQDRLTEKRFLQSLGLLTAPFAPVDDGESLAAALSEIGAPALLKTRRFGYDGKGQVRLESADEAAAAMAEINHQSAILEGMVPFISEISVIAARGIDGRVAAFDPGQNRHEGGILRETMVPAPLPPRLVSDAVLIAGKILNALDYVGVIGVELFVTPAGLVVNEFAPRVHNSGHWTQNGCSVDQFEQHIRAIIGWPLGDGARHSDVTMVNLIGADLDSLPDWVARDGAALHLYGKADTRAGRKMGHVNLTRPRS